MAAQHTEGHVAAVARGLVAADATRSTTAPPLRADTLDAATLSAIVAAVAAYDAMVTAQEDHDASGGGGGGASATKSSDGAHDDSPPQLASNLLGETVAAILLVRSELAGLHDDVCVSLQLELARRGAEEQWVGRASEWKAQALELVKARADEQTQLGAAGMKYGVNVCARRSAIGRAMLRFLGTGDLLRCAEACRTLARWSKGAVLAWKFREDVSDAAVAQIAAQYVNLRVVDLSGCVQVTDVSIVAMAESCPWLKSVDLSGKFGWGNHSKITDVAIVALAKKCARLKSANLAYCSLLTDASIVPLAGSCPLLKIVNLRGCKLLTDVSIVAFSGSCPLLKCVNLHGCKLITDVSIGALAGLYD